MSSVSMLVAITVPGLIVIFVIYCITRLSHHNDHRIKQRCSLTK